MTHDPPPFRRGGLDAVVDAIGRGPLWPPLAYALLVPIVAWAIQQSLGRVLGVNGRVAARAPPAGR